MKKGMNRMNTPPLRTKRNRRLAGLLFALALTAAIIPQATAEEALGRLFFTPERRQTLDRQRRLNIQEKQEIPEDPMLTINGVVTRSSGKSTVWINGVSQNENETRNGVAVTPNGKEPGRIVVQTTEVPTTEAKVGDTIKRNSGESTDLLNDGRIEIRRATTLRPATDR
jgi:hypothetical protein